MAVQSHRKPAPDLLPRRPMLRVVEPRETPQLHLLTYMIGNALFWTLWAAIWVSADPWYWWPIVPGAGWALVLACALEQAAVRSRPMSRT